MQINGNDILIPLDVPKKERGRYIENYLAITKESGRLMLFAGDQKVEHLNDDFYGPEIDPEDSSPEHLFKIASSSRIGAFATQLGLIARYGMDYSEIPYIVKLDSKTNLIKTTQLDPFSPEWYGIHQLTEFRDESGLNIHGVGYTVYPGSEHETEMLHQAAQVVYHAHQHGLVTILWMYPRGKAVKDERDPHLIAGVAGVASALGSDFVKVNYPLIGERGPCGLLREAVLAAGRTKVVCAGGARVDVESFLRQLYGQIHTDGASGNATGRNIHQKPLDEAVRFCSAIYAITVEDASVEAALKIYSSENYSAAPKD